MDRAQRRLATSDAIFARAHALREQAATSALPQEAQLAALDRQSQQLAEVELRLQAIAAIPRSRVSARRGRRPPPHLGGRGWVLTCFVVSVVALGRVVSTVPSIPGARSSLSSPYAC